MNKIGIFACPSADSIATDVARILKLGTGKISFSKFKNDNTFVQIGESVRGRDIFIFQTTLPPVNERVMELLISIDAFRRSGARSITAVLPYFMYARSDKKDQPRIAVTAKLFAKMLETAGATRVISCDMHNPAIQSYFDINCECITARFTLQKYFYDKHLGDDIVVVATDAGSSKAAFKYSEFFKCPVALIDKRRDGNDDRAIANNVIGNVKNMNCLIFDDEVDTAGSLVETARILEHEGAKRIFAGCSHGVLSDVAVDRIINSPINELVITDSIPLLADKACDKIKVVTIAPVIADTIIRLSKNYSLCSLKY